MKIPSRQALFSLNVALSTFAEKPFISEIQEKGKYRWQILLKGSDTGAVKNLAKEILSKAFVTGVDIRVDVDPVNFM